MGLQCICHSLAAYVGIPWGNAILKLIWLVILRLLLGASEGCITNGVMLVTSMFYTRTESGQRIGWTFQCNGFAQIVSGFLAFGVAHSSPTKKPAQWQLLLIVYTGLTLIIGTWLLLAFPDSPVKARFLTEDQECETHQIQPERDRDQSMEKRASYRGRKRPQDLAFLLIWCCIVR